MEKQLLILLLFLYPVLLLEFTRFLSQYPTLDDFYYHGTAALSVSVTGKLDISLYQYYSYPTTFTLGAIFYEISGLDGFVFADVYSIFTAMYIGIIGFLAGKHIFHDFSAASIFSISSVLSAYFFPRWFSPFSVSAIFTMILFYQLLVLCTEHDSRRSIITFLMIPSLILAHIPNSLFFSICLLVLLLLIPFNYFAFPRKFANNDSEYFRIPTFIVLFTLCLFLFWNLFVNDFQFSRLIKEIANTLLNPPIEEVLHQFTEVYFRKYDPLSVLRRIYILSIPIIGSIGSFAWFMYYRQYPSIKKGSLIILFLAHYLFVGFSVFEYFVRFGFAEGYGIAHRVRWLLYLTSSWWIAVLLIDANTYFNYMKKTFHSSHLKKILFLLLSAGFLLSSGCVFYINLTDGLPRVVQDHDIEFNAFLSRFVSVNSNLYGYMTQNGIFYYFLVANHGIQYANRLYRLISIPEAIYDYDAGLLNNRLNEMNVLIVMNINRTKLIYPNLEQALDEMFLHFNAEKVNVVFDNGDHKIFLK